jgi:predicted pyridoxine 5'-phosphate oxidase superfamily flavin-nucleotide-binding protein
MTYHEGELEMQRRAGVVSMASRVARIISPEIPAVAAAFLANEPYVVVATVDSHGATTASLLVGSTHAADPSTVVLTPTAGHVERAFADIHDTGVIGLLAIDLATRRRMRVNGNAVVRGKTIVVTTREVYSNCPQYITPRHFAPAAISQASADIISRADTFFLATSHPTRGADISHRGGPAGFVRIESTTQLSWPDYPGNNMFNSLGNLLSNPRCGLLFVDFETGATLQLHGTAEVRGDDEREIVFTTEA